MANRMGRAQQAHLRQELPSRARRPIRRIAILPPGCATVSSVFSTVRGRRIASNTTRTGLENPVAVYVISGKSSQTPPLSSTAIAIHRPEPATSAAVVQIAGSAACANCAIDPRSSAPAA